MFSTVIRNESKRSRESTLADSIETRKKKESRVDKLFLKLSFNLSWLFDVITFSDKVTDSNTCTNADSWNSQHKGDLIHVEMSVKTFKRVASNDESGTS